MPDKRDTTVSTSRRHPLFHGGKWLLADLLSTLTFVALYAISHNIFLATGLAIALGVGQIAYLKLRQAPIDLMQWLSLFLVVIFGSATLLTHDPVFVKIKPTLIYIAIGAVMLRPAWINRYIQPVPGVSMDDIGIAFGYIWSALMFATAVANLAVAMYATTATWAWFISVFPIASKIVLVAIQYITTRTIVRGRIRASRAMPVPNA